MFIAMFYKVMKLDCKRGVLPALYLSLDDSFGNLFGSSWWINASVYVTGGVDCMQDWV